jgi:carboxymethylenebutenolidase
VTTTYPVASGTLPAYLAVPTTPGPWPGVVVLHEIFGLNDDIRAQADRLAANGYLAIAPDLFAWGATPRCLVASLKAMAKGDGRLFDDVEGARQFLLGRDDCSGAVGVIGFCFGGGLAILVAPKGFTVSAPNYGHLPRKPEQVLRGSCPTVASYGAKDWTLRSAAPKLASALAALGVEHDVKEYPTAKHGFLFEHTGRTAWSDPWMVSYDAAAADDAWRRIFTFFDGHLKATTTSTEA